MAHRERPLDKGLFVMNDSPFCFMTFFFFFSKMKSRIIDNTRLGSRIGKHGNEIFLRLMHINWIMGSPLWVLSIVKLESFENLRRHTTPGIR